MQTIYIFYDEFHQLRLIDFRDAKEETVLLIGKNRNQEYPHVVIMNVKKNEKIVGVKGQVNRRNNQIVDLEFITNSFGDSFFSKIVLDNK